MVYLGLVVLQENIEIARVKKKLTDIALTYNA